MKVIEPSAVIMDYLDEFDASRRIEFCGRVCYKSEGAITMNSHKTFCRNVLANEHSSVMEMAVVSLMVKIPEEWMIQELYEIKTKYLVIDEIEYNTLLVTGSIRAFRDLLPAHLNNSIVYSMLAYLSVRHSILFEDKHITTEAVRDIAVWRVSLLCLNDLAPTVVRRHRFVAVKLIANRAVTHEIVRHRPCSFLQESQRYCRYDKEQFGREVTFIRPMFFSEGSPEYVLWERAMLDTERIYLKLLETSSAQAARTVLPNSCKTEIIIFANLEEWQHIFKLHTSPAAELSMRQVMIPLVEQFKTRFPAIFGGTANA